MSEYKQKIYYGHKVGELSLTVPCPHGKMPRVGSSSCEDCENFIRKNGVVQYIICTRKPALLEALEAFINAKSIKNAPEIIEQCKSAISAAYGETQEDRG